VRVSERRGFWDRFWELLENDSVRPFVSMYYAPWLVWAILATFWFPPVTLIQTAMGAQVYTLWVWVTIPGTIAPMVGLALRHGGSSVANMTTPLLFQDWMGLVMQATGHAASCVLLILLEYSLVQGAVHYWDDQGTYAGVTILFAFLLSAYMFGTGWLAAQCLRKIQKGEQLKRGLM
jgi:hypothetical protein